jgi:hypothetical protein
VAACEPQHAAQAIRHRSASSVCVSTTAIASAVREQLHRAPVRAARRILPRQPKAHDRGAEARSSSGSGRLTDQAPDQGDEIGGDANGSRFLRRRPLRPGTPRQPPQPFSALSGSSDPKTCAPRVWLGWGARIRTWEWRNQNPLPYHLATPQRRPQHLVPCGTCENRARGTIAAARQAINARACRAFEPTL